MDGLFFGVGGAFALYYLTTWLRVPAVHVSVDVPRLAWVSVAIVLILGGLVLPVIASFQRTSGFAGARSLDGLAFARAEPDFGAIDWLPRLPLLFVFLFLAVWIPCCFSDIVFPLLWADKEDDHADALEHAHH